MRKPSEGVAARAMRPADASKVAALIRAAFAAQPVALDPPPSALRVTAGDVVAHLARAGCGGAVIERDGRMVGCVLWEREADGLYVSRLAVAPAWRRGGLGRALLASAEAAARAASLDWLRLGTRLALSGNRRLFAASGFAETAFHAHPGFPAPTWVEMTKRLG
jgi:predicted N-acetyltransferase YhbS